MSIQNPQERAAKVIEFLKTLGSNPERKIEDIAKDVQISRTSAYHYINEYVKDVIMMDSDPDFPRRVLLLYNKDLSGGSDKLSAMDIEQLKHFVDEYYSRNLPGKSHNMDLVEKHQDI